MGLLQQVNEAFKACNSLLALSRSPLAASALVTPALVLDDVTPTPDERGRALRIVLQWGVEQLAPAPAQFPFDVFRPWDDPTWREPRWWRYNILRHRYLEPLHPDEFVAGGRFTETLLNLTGISTADALFDERNRALRDVATTLQFQATERTADAALQQLAVTAACRPLAGEPHALALLGIASVFEGVFAADWLSALAATESIDVSRAVLDILLTRRLLLAGDEGSSLWLAAPLRIHLAQHQPRHRQALRHRWVAQRYAAMGDLLAAARHWQVAQDWTRAADALLQPRADWPPEQQAGALRSALAAFRPSSLDRSRWRQVQMALADVSAETGDAEAAIAAARAALKASPTPALQAQAYRRLGKLYEQRNPLHALGYYRAAAERFAPDDPELVTLLKDRGWLHILRRAWPEAELDLLHALEYVQVAQRAVRADIFDALASLHRNQRQLTLAVDYAQQALALREAEGQPLPMAKSLGNLGLLYTSMGDYAQAVEAHREAMKIYTQLGNQELTATAWLNIGLAHHLGAELPAAVAAYRTCLAMAREVNLPLAEVKVLSNLAEALLTLGDVQGARQCWRAGVETAQAHEFEDQVSYFAELAGANPVLGALEAARPTPLTPPTHNGLTSGQASLIPLTPDAQNALELTRRHGQVTARMLMRTAHVSKPTATRRLNELVACGQLVRRGAGRSTSYVLVSQSDPDRAVLAALHQALTPLRTELTTKFHVRTMSLWTQAPAAATLTLVLAFERLPDLLTFLQLEKRLAAVVGFPLRLLPAAALDGAERNEGLPIW